MLDIYNFLAGPMVWIALIVFIGGTLFRIIQLFMLAYRKEKFVFTYMNLKYGLRSILHWLTPFGTRNMRNHPVTTIIMFLFHICLLITPIFLLAHIILLDESLNINWWALPNGLADFMALIVVFGCLFFLFRRIMLPEVRFLSSRSDFLLLAVIAAPFISGLWASHQISGYSYALLFHILTGEIMLMAIPFTRLIHMLFAVFTRAYTGSEFGGVRHARDW